MNIILLGAPGAGKGTVSQYLIEKYNFSQISTGDLIRDEIKSGSELGKKLVEITSTGGLVDSKTVYSLITNKIHNLQEQNKSIIFDGFPRNLEQAKWLDEVINVDKVVALECPLDIILERLTTRRFCPKCKFTTNIRTDEMAVKGICAKCGAELATRTDDNVETIKKRYQLFLDNNSSIVKHYADKLVSFSSIDSDSLKHDFDKLLKA